MTPAEVVDEITRSGLRGRGGAGYPTGLKWAHGGQGRRARRSTSICNADEGDPGAFMDRSVLESDPHRVLEGMAIAGYAVGASQGYIYVRGEYPLAIRRLRDGHPPGRAAGLLGSQHLRHRPSTSSVDMRHRRRGVRLRRGDGADRLDRGRAGHAPAPAALPGRAGLWGSPTLINNVETFANVAADHPQRRRLVRRHRHREEQGHQGLRPGRQGASTPAWSRCRWAPRCARSSRTSAAASPTGGRSRRCRPAGRPAAASPAEYLDTPVDYESLTERRLDHGLGRHDRHGRDAPAWSTWPASSWTSAWRSRAASASPAGPAPCSCTGCSTRISERRRRPRPTWTSWRRCATWSSTRACAAWARRAPNPVLSTLRYFRDEYLAHIRRPAPARPGVCADRRRPASGGDAA